MKASKIWRARLRAKILLAAVCLAVLLPLACLLAASLAGGGRGYKALLAPQNPFWRAYGNTLLVCAASLTGQLAISVLGGWGLARYRFAGRGPLLFICVLLMLLPVQALLLPQYLLLRTCGLLDSLWALSLPGVCSPLGAVLLWHGFHSLPTEMLEAAQAEGAGLWVVLRRIALPACRRELAVLLLVTLSEQWNLLEQPMAYLKTPESFPLSIYLATDALRAGPERFAACVAALVPLLTAFLLLVGAALPQEKE